MSNTITTPDELLARSDEKEYELSNGQLVKRGGGFEASHVASQLAGAMFLFNQTARRGWVQGANCGYVLPGFDGLTVRKPKASFVSFQRLPATGVISKGYPEVAPELAVEVLSRDDFVYDVESKLMDYLTAGVRSVWIVNPVGRSVQVYRQDGSIGRLQEPDQLDGEDILPGFICLIRTLFETPQPNIGS